MKLLRFCTKVFASFALIGAPAGCGGGGPEPFAPGSTPAATPAATSSAEPSVTGGRPSSSPRRFQQGSIQTQGPQAHP